MDIRHTKRRAQLHAGRCRGALAGLLLLGAGCLSDSSTRTTGAPSGSGLPDGGLTDTAPPFMDIDGGTPVGPRGLVVGSDVATLSIPAGALRSTHNALVQRSAAAPPLPVGVRALSAVVELLPTGLSLAKPATLTIAFSSGATDAFVLGAQNDVWTQIAGAAIDAAVGQATVDVTLFGRVVVVTAEDADAGADGD